MEITDKPILIRVWFEIISGSTKPIERITGNKKRPKAWLNK